MKTEKVKNQATGMNQAQRGASNGDPNRTQNHLSARIQQGSARVAEG
jgi:hypothetical protein